MSRLRTGFMIKPVIDSGKPGCMFNFGASLEIEMRGILLLPVVMMAACSTDVAPAPAAPLADSYATLPDFRPETAAACNSVGLSVTYAQGGSVTVNGAASNMDGLMAAAARKNAVCGHAPAVVNLSITPGVPEREAEDLRERLAGVITNLALSEGK